MSTLSKLMKAAKESVDAMPPVELSPEEIAENETALADDRVTVDVIDELQAPIAELDAGLNDVDAAEAEADSLTETAAALDASLSTDEGGAGQGIDPVAAEIVSDQIQEAVERFALNVKTKRPARESFGTSEGKRGVTRSLAREAAEAAAGLRERAVAAIKQAVAWLTDILKTAFDQAYRVEKRAKALATSARSAKSEGGQELKVNGAFLGGKGALETARALTGMSKNLAALGAAVTDSTGASTQGAIDLNPDGVAGATLRVDFSGDKAVFVKEAGSGDSEKLKAFSSAEATSVANFVAQAAHSLSQAKSQFDAITKNSLSLIGALKSGEDNAARAKAVSTVTAVTRAAAAVMSLGLGTGSRLLDAVDASLKVKPAAEPAAGAAAA